MEEYLEKYRLAKEDNDIASQITILDDMLRLREALRYRRTFKSCLKDSQPERKEISYDYLWLTVNPSPETTFTTFRNLVGKMIQKKWIKSYVYVYEQRGISQDDLGKGFHLHAIIMKPEDKSPAHCIREISSTYKKVCDVSNYHCFNTKWIGKEEYIRKLEYILGQKESTSENNKALKQEMDKVWRQARNIDSYYYLNIDIGQYAP